MSTVTQPAPSPADASASTPRTLPGWLLHQVQVRSRATAMRVKDLGRWQETSWAEYAERVAGVGRALMHMGVKAGDRVAIISGNRAEWIVTDLAVQGIGAATVSLSVTAAPEQTADLLAEASVDVVVVEDEEQLDKVLEVRDRLTLRHVVVIDPRGIRRLEDPVSGFEALEALGSRDAIRARDGDVDAWAKSVAALDPTSIAAIVFTAGTTGTPKGAQLTHDALTAAAASGSAAIELRAGDEIVSTLPLSDVAERSLTAAQAILAGAVVNFGEGGRSLGNDFREVQPTVVLASPSFWERFREEVDAGERGIGFVKRRAMRAARRGRGVISGVLVRRPLRSNLGLARTRVAISATAPCGADLVQFWRRLGLPLRQAYSLSELGGFAAVARSDDPAGSVGPSVGGVEIEVAGDGVRVRSSSTDRWIDTGDVGTLDGGVLSITGRTSDIVATASGQAAPRPIEASLEESPYVRTAVVVGAGRPGLGALIVIDATTVGDWAVGRGASFTTFATLTALPEVHELVGEVVQEVNARLGAESRVSCFCVLPQELGDDEELVTDTHKIRRAPVAVRFAEQIDRMYAGGDTT